MYVCMESAQRSRETELEELEISSIYMYQLVHHTCTTKYSMYVYLYTKANYVCTYTMRNDTR